MACFRTLRAFSVVGAKTESGKQLIVFNESKLNGRPYEEIKLPCGQCLGCRIDKARDWAVRCVHESQMSQGQQNSFVTLTFNPETLQDRVGLEKRHFQLFMKRLRKRYTGRTIRYLQCGEYGERCQVCNENRMTCRKARKHTFVAGLGRPHHHACLFGIEFEDM